MDSLTHREIVTHTPISIHTSRDMSRSEGNALQPPPAIYECNLHIHLIRKSVDPFSEALRCEKDVIT